MGTYTYIPKRKPKNFKNDVDEILTIFPMGYSNRSNDEDFHYYGSCSYGRSNLDYSSRSVLKYETRLASRHRAVALAWEKDFSKENIPLVTVVDPDFCQITGKWEPIEGGEIYRFTNGCISSAFNAFKKRSTLHLSYFDELKTQDYRDVPCFWYDVVSPGEKVGVFNKRNGVWVVTKSVPNTSTLQTVCGNVT